MSEGYVGSFFGAQLVALFPLLRPPEYPTKSRMRDHGYNHPQKI